VLKQSLPPLDVKDGAIILPVADLKPDERIKAVYHF